MRASAAGFKRCQTTILIKPGHFLIKPGHFSPLGERRASFEDRLAALGAKIFPLEWHDPTGSGDPSFVKLAVRNGAGGKGRQNWKIFPLESHKATGSGDQSFVKLAVRAVFREEKGANTKGEQTAEGKGRLIRAGCSATPVPSVLLSAPLLVFPPCQALGLTQYSRVLVLDIDAVVLRNIDHLAAAPAPAFVYRRHPNFKCWADVGDPSCLELDPAGIK